jgi:WD40 repeat protein
MDPFEFKMKEDFDNKIFSMDIGGNKLLTGHDRNLSFRDTAEFDEIWEKSPDPNRKAAPDHLKVMLDPHGRVAVTSTTDKLISMYECSSGKLLCKAQCGELTTGLTFSENGRHLISTSSLGVIYVWKLPEKVSKIL